MSPRAKYTTALAAAVSPINRLLVAVETFIGMCIAKSIAGTFSTPEPMPSKPLRVPARYMSPSPSPVLTTT